MGFYARRQSRESVKLLAYALVGANPTNPIEVYEVSFVSMGSVNVFLVKFRFVAVCLV